MSAYSEPQVTDANTRLSFEVIDIECRFSDGRKIAAISVDADFPQLAEEIAQWLSQRAKK